MHGVAESEHGPHSSEGLVCIVFDVLPECESTIKEEPQVLPSGAWVKCPHALLDYIVITLGELAYIVIEYTPIILCTYYEYNQKDRY
jgi:hypothetical protein